jgi:hypothetical protein
MTEQNERSEPVTAEQQWQRDNEMLKRRMAHQAREAAQAAARGQKPKPDTSET